MSVGQSFFFISANQDWSSSGITMATENWSAAEIANRPSMEDFQSTFDVVFVDASGYLNLCSDMSAANYRLVHFTYLLLFIYLLNCA